MNTILKVGLQICMIIFCLSLIMIDADLCGKNIRKMDILARFGRDEFVILMPEVEAESILTKHYTKQRNQAATRYRYGNSENFGRSILNFKKQSIPMEFVHH